jgi:hypothetical protein
MLVKPCATTKSTSSAGSGQGSASYLNCLDVESVFFEQTQINRQPERSLPAGHADVRGPDLLLRLGGCAGKRQVGERHDAKREKRVSANAHNASPYG